MAVSCRPIQGGLKIELQNKLTSFNMHNMKIPSTRKWKRRCLSSFYCFFSVSWPPQLFLHHFQYLVSSCLSICLVSFLVINFDFCFRWVWMPISNKLNCAWQKCRVYIKSAPVDFKSVWANLMHSYQSFFFLYTFSIYIVKLRHFWWEEISKRYMYIVGVNNKNKTLKRYLGINRVTSVFDPVSLKLT